MLQARREPGERRLCMYSVGDKIMYGGTGVCVIEDITMVKLSGMDKPRQYYTLRPLYQSGTIQTPVDSDKIPIRPVMSRSEAEELVDGIPRITASICYEKNLSALRNHYQQQLSSFECRDLIRMTKSIYAKKKDAESRQKHGAGDDRPEHGTISATGWSSTPRHKRIRHELTP